MSTETLDQLYLEWSQFTKARTAREIALVGLLGEMTYEMAAYDSKPERELVKRAYTLLDEVK